MPEEDQERLATDLSGPVRPLVTTAGSGPVS